MLLYLKYRKFSIDIDENRCFSEQKKERIAYILDVWETIIALVDENRVDFKFLSVAINPQNNRGVGLSIYKLSPSYKSAKIIKLRLLQKGLI